MIRFRCPECNVEMESYIDRMSCPHCSVDFEVRSSVWRFINDEFHENFSYQWRLYREVQLDSVNGSSESLNRLKLQTGLDSLHKLEGGQLLEIGCGAGRFSEILCLLDCELVMMDYSRAIDEAKLTVETTLRRKRISRTKALYYVQGDLLHSPLCTEQFDTVICFGVIQHTGNNELAIEKLISLLKPNGTLYFDIYSNSARHFNPFIYLIRFFCRCLNLQFDTRKRLALFLVNVFWPFYFKFLFFLNGEKFRWVRACVNRAPIAVYPINLCHQGILSEGCAKLWCQLDTLDSYGPNFDHPVSEKKLYEMLKLMGYKFNFKLNFVKNTGQGICVSLSRL